MRILILDDHQLFLDGLRHVVARLRSVTGVDTTQDAAGALHLIERQHYGLILADLAMPGLDGFNFLRRYGSGGSRPLSW